MIIDIIKTRRSVREFSDKEIPKDYEDILIDAIIYAPSAGNLQARKFFLVKDKKIRLALAKAALNQYFIYRAPLVVVGCADLERIIHRYGERGVSLYSIMDVSCSIMQMLLVAHELGLGSTWVSAFNEEEVSKILNLPESLRPVVIVPVGFPKENPITPKIRERSELITTIE